MTPGAKTSETEDAAFGLCVSCLEMSESPNNTFHMRTCTLLLLLLWRHCLYIYPTVTDLCPQINNRSHDGSHTRHVGVF